MLLLIIFPSLSNSSSAVGYFVVVDCFFPLVSFFLCLLTAFSFWFLFDLPVLAICVVIVRFFCFSLGVACGDE